MTAKTMFEKTWEAHVVKEEPGKPAPIYIDLHLVSKVTAGPCRYLHPALRG